MAIPRLRVFISSPGDVTEERVLATKVVRRLADEIADRVMMEPIIWEAEPLLATSTFQKQIPKPSQCHVVLCILWSRLGTRLPADIVRPVDTPGGPAGSRYSSGTEYEFEDAVEGFRNNKWPDLLVYRKTAEPVASLRDTKALLARVAQKEALDGFIHKWFVDKADGSLKAAFHPFEDAAHFEQIVEDHLRKLLARRLPKKPADAGTPATPKIAWSHGSPFRGLEAFDFDHAAVYFGRTKAISDVLGALRRNTAEGRSFVLVTGVSGGGKSSLVRAGVLPLLTQPGVIERTTVWRRAVMRPAEANGNPLLALSRALFQADALPELADDGTTGEQLAESMRRSPAAAYDIIKGAIPGGASGRLALVVDQLEELFSTDGIDAVARVAFASVISALARSGRAIVIATLRGDFVHRVFEIPELLALAEGAGQYVLALPSAGEVSQMIHQPARAAGLSFEEDPATKVPLDEALREAAATSPESLPLLEFTLEELYARRTPEGVLTYAAYESLGGVEGALSRRAEETFSSLPPTVQAAFPVVFRDLVAVGESGATVTRKQASVDTLCTTPAAQALVESLVAARLLTTDRSGSGEVTVRVAHEALLRVWPRVREWLEHDRELLRIRARIGAAAARWQRDGSPADLLLPAGKPLDEGLLLRDAAGYELTPTERQYVEASLAKARRGKRAKRAAVTALAVLAILAAAGAIFANLQRSAAVTSQRKALASEAVARQNEALARENETRAIQNEERAKASEAQTELTLARGLISQGDAQVAANQWSSAKTSYEEAAKRFIAHGADPVEADVATMDVSRYSPPEVAVLTQPTGIAENDPAVLLGYYAMAGRDYRSSVGHLESVTSISLDRTGRRLFVATRHAPANYWDIPTNRMLRTFNGHRAGEDRAAVSPDGTWAVSGGPNGTTIRWDMATGKLLDAWKDQTGRYGDAFIAGDGGAILTSAEEGVTTVRTGSQFSERLTFKGRGNWISQPVNGARTIVGQNADGHLAAWIYRGGSIEKTYEIQTAGGARLLTPDGHLMLGTRQGDRFEMFDATTELVFKAFPLAYLRDPTTSFVDSWKVLGNAGGNSITLFDFGKRAETDPSDKPASGGESRRFTGFTEPISTPVLATPDARFALAGSRDITVRVWPLSAGGAERQIRFGDGRSFAVVLLGDGRLLATVSGKEDAIHLVDVDTFKTVTDRALPLRSNGTRIRVNSMVGTSDGARVAIGSRDGEVLLWDWVTNTFTAIDQGNSGDVVVAWSGDGRRLAWTGSKGLVKVWDLSTSALLFQTSKPNDVMSTVALSQDGSVVAAGKSVTTKSGFLLEENLWIFDVSSGKRQPSPKVTGPRSLYFLPGSGDLLVGAGGEHFVLPNGKFAQSTQYGGAVGGAVSWQNGRAILRDYGRIKIYDRIGGTPIRSIPAQGGDMLEMQLLVTGDGNSLLTGNLRYGGGVHRLDLNWASRLRELLPKVEAARLVARDSDDPGALATLGRWYAFCGIYDWAGEVCEKSNDLGGHVPAFDIGRYYWACGRTASAVKWLRKARETDGETTDPYRLMWYRMTEPPPRFASVTPPPTTLPATPATRPAGTMPAVATKEAADRCFAAEDWPNALAIYRQLLDQNPSQLQQLADRLGTLYASTGDLKAAAELFERAAELPTSNMLLLYKATCLRAVLGEEEHYRDDCRRMLAKYQGSEQKEYLERTAKACLLRPGGVTDLSPVYSAAARALADEQPDNFLKWYRLAAALSEYRQGHHQAALSLLRKIDGEFTYYSEASAGTLLRAACEFRLKLPTAPAALAKARSDFSSGIGSTPSAKGGVENWCVAKVLEAELRDLVGAETWAAAVAAPGGLSASDDVKRLIADRKIEAALKLYTEARLIPSTDPGYFDAQFLIYGSAGEFGALRNLCEAQLAADPSVNLTWYRTALLRAYLHDDSASRSMAPLLLQRFGEEGGFAAQRAATACLLVPEFVNSKALRALVERTQAGGASAEWSRINRGILELHDGNWSAVIAAVGKNQDQLPDLAKPLAAYLMAAAHRQLGHAPESARSLAKAHEMASKYVGRLPSIDQGQVENWLVCRVVIDSTEVMLQTMPAVRPAQLTQATSRSSTEPSVANAPSTTPTTQPNAGGRDAGDVLYANGDYAAALQSYNSFLRDNPDRANDLAGRLADLQAYAGQFREAATTLERNASADRGGQIFSIYRAACLRAYVAEEEAYRADCRILVARFGNTMDRTHAERVAKTCLMRPGAVADLSLIDRVSDQAVQGELAHNYLNSFRLARAMYFYRVGRYSDALALLNKAGGRFYNTRAIEATADLLSCAIYHKLEDEKSCIASLRHAHQRLQEVSPTPSPGQSMENWLVCMTLANEVRELVGPAAWTAAAPPKFPELTFIRTLNEDDRPISINRFIKAADDSVVVTTGLDSTIRVWGPALDKPIVAWPSTDNESIMAVSDHGDTAIFVGDGNALYVRKLPAGGLRHTLKGHTANVRNVAISGDGRTALSVSQDGTLRQWDLEAGKEIQSLRGHKATAWVLSVAISPDGKFAATGGNDGDVVLWDLRSGTETIRMSPGNWVRTVQFFTDAKRLLVCPAAMPAGTLRVMDIQSKSQLTTLEMPDMTGATLSLDQRRIVAGSLQGKLKVFDLETKTETARLPRAAPLSKRWSVAFWQENYVIASGDGNIFEIYRIPTLASHQLPDAPASQPATENAK